MKNEGRELTDEELEQVVGGGENGQIPVEGDWVVIGGVIGQQSVSHFVPIFDSSFVPIFESSTVALQTAYRAVSVYVDQNGAHGKVDVYTYNPASQTVVKSSEPISCGSNQTISRTNPPDWVGKIND